MKGFALFSLLFIFFSLCLVSQAQDIVDVKNEIKRIDILIDRINDCPVCLETRIKGASELFGVYEGFAFIDTGAREIIKLKISVGFANNITVFANRNSPIVIEYGRQKYYLLGGLFYGGDTAEIIYEDTIKKLFELNRLFLNFHRLLKIPD